MLSTIITMPNHMSGVTVTPLVSTTMIGPVSTGRGVRSAGRVFSRRSIVERPGCTRAFTGWRPMRTSWRSLINSAQFW